MSAGIELACTVCDREFVVPVAAYRARAGIVHCPGCGSTDLVLLRSDEATRTEPGDDAAHDQLTRRG